MLTDGPGGGVGVGTAGDADGREGSEDSVGNCPEIDGDATAPKCLSAQPDAAATTARATATPYTLGSFTG